MAISSIPPTNCWTEAEHNLAQSLAACVSVQSFLGVLDKPTALAGNMYIDSFPEPTDGEAYSADEIDSLFPAVLIGGPQDDDAFRMLHVASPGLFSPTGVLEIMFERVEEESETLQDQERIFKNQVGNILVELTDRINAEDGFYIEQLTAGVSRMSENKEQTISPIQRALVVIPWGTNNPGGDEGN